MLDVFISVVLGGIKNHCYVMVTVQTQQIGIMQVNYKEIVNFKKGIGIERYTQFTTVTLIYEKST